MILYSIIIFTTVLIISLFSYFVLGNSFFVTFGYSWLGVLYELLLNGIVALVIEKMLPTKIFYKNNWLYKTSEKEIKFYNFLKIRSWKDKVLELGKLGGFSKGKLESVNNENYLNKFILETNKGILIHFSSIFICIFLFVVPPLINKYYITVPIVIVAIILNILPLLILKYVKPKILKLVCYNNKRKDKEKGAQ